jgi:hypothetical protein
MSAGVFVFDGRLDGAFLESIYEGDMEHAEMVFDQFLRTIPGQLKEIKDHFHSSDIENFRKNVHKIKPVLSYVGLTALTEKAAVLEKQCKQVVSIHDVSGLYSSFSIELNEMLPIIENELIKIRNL